ncbi:hypothetical protein GLOIN_2v1682224 [Rhizophagus irregularis DAOM 181602=DAOM 197198]|uniref:DUF8211 domain-containing protein n=1 Tax=Rhizophagus irregularis (strain DAOM 181602 / DAOM 197198 / MUCL 43194) TaxID=747089 RepID=A0A2P4PEN1_RHIID|nr:hypothetical protein GLOIN_2v1682224 [Rhizophagus irregularis DAOM 181602=DAOM 197198]POG63843.1 hypothetical protein GLOIN_2v1682224 [Rhizophagus irregularis DAOM 181602=DAOM 197198]|eukprot:XP_025170709.1 hypothetical protein GLOIN_2v1682224 [Rhizophagus irregularis DAOM 181602=DAOM 197198]
MDTDVISVPVQLVHNDQTTLPLPLLSPSKTFNNTSNFHKNTFLVSVKKFHVMTKRRTGYNKIYEFRRSKSFFFELADLFSDTNNLHLFLHTNDYHMDSTPILYTSTSYLPNTKYQISKMLTHFFTLQKVLPQRIQQKYFDLIRQKLLDRIDFIESRASNRTLKNTHTKTFFSFSYKRYRFHFGIYIPCEHVCTPALSNSLTRCHSPSPFVMSLNRRACGTHQPEFSRTKINHHLKPVPELDPGYTNSKSSHANHVYDLWQHRWKNEIFSNRLGIQYNVCYVANSTNFVRKHPGAYIYRKHLSNFKLNHSSNPATKRKQETRFKRHCARVLKTIDPTSRTLKDYKLSAGRRFRFLFDESQHIYSPLHHLKFKKFSTEKLLPDPDDYRFKIPHHTLPNCSTTSQPSTLSRPSGVNTIPHYLNAAEIEALMDSLEPLPRSTIYYGYNPVDPSKVNSSYYLQYNPFEPDLPPTTHIRRSNPLDYDSSAANGMGTTLKHYYRRGISTRQLTVHTNGFHEQMNQPPPPPMPCKKKQHRKWKKWVEKYQDYYDYTCIPYSPRPCHPAEYHIDLFGLPSYTSDET